MGGKATKGKFPLSHPSPLIQLHHNHHVKIQYKFINIFVLISFDSFVWEKRMKVPNSVFLPKETFSREELTEFSSRTGTVTHIVD